jgi:lipopolysaccharide/colanic/teichoic acid biosynthesis glycosyltransferase
VFKGEMSVVGPRPHMLKHTEQYASIDSFMIRHAIKPGITGWAQINGLRGETKEDGQMEMRLEKDLEYLNKWTFMFDIRIVFLSVFVMFKSHKNAF